MRYLLGNWKSNGNGALLDAFSSQWPKFPNTIQVGLALPFPWLTHPFSCAWRGAQNVSAFGPGAFTGEVHAGMLKELALDFCLVGHSERRHLMGETVAHTAQKVAALIEQTILPVFCVGETLAERQAGQLETVLERQLEPLRAIKASVLIAYEPVWAIGTGVAATPDDADQAHSWIRNWCLAQGLVVPPILYGGSVSPQNAHQLAQIASIDGFLVGGASLKPDPFFEIGAQLAR
ncbi:MAG: triose-phosphate isomerase [Acidobacteria bacterium]|nr:triose-phosphate isomerase [Acidobacteriota bacterium]MCB9398480.1 triose-phosphate isomerase [Acidobacteriota bacterium]